MRVTGFEYEVELDSGERRWCQLRGKGGLLGTGCVHGHLWAPGKGTAAGEPMARADVLRALDADAAKAR